jgi:hypothetical protein
MLYEYLYSLIVKVNQEITVITQIQVPCILTCNYITGTTFLGAPTLISLILGYSGANLQT